MPVSWIYILINNLFIFEIVASLCNNEACNPQIRIVSLSFLPWKSSSKIYCKSEDFVIFFLFSFFLLTTLGLSAVFISAVCCQTLYIFTMTADSSWYDGAALNVRQQIICDCSWWEPGDHRRSFDGDNNRDNTDKSWLAAVAVILFSPGDCWRRWTPHSGFWFPSLV